MSTIKTIQTYLPVFPGFYCTFFDPDHGLENETDYLREEGTVPADWTPDFDFSGYCNKVAAEACNWVYLKTNDHTELNANWFSQHQVCPLGIKSVTLECLRSPKEYNFANDAIDCAIELDIEVFAQAFTEIIKEYSEEWKTYLRERYKSRSGFFSSYPHHPDDWKEITDGFRFSEWEPLESEYSKWNWSLPPPSDQKAYLRRLKDRYDMLANGKHGLGACLNFLFETCMSEAEMNLYYYTAERVYISEFITNVPETEALS